MIKSFHCEETARIFSGERSRRLPGDIQGVALRKLIQLDLAARLDDLRSPPGNRLEALTFDRASQHSIRINKQWRLCSAGRTAKPTTSRVDYH